jgi:malonyl CoA-acyl carrier protein transacylase
MYGMGVVVGLDERTVSRLADEPGTRKAPVHTANVNAPLQISVAGTDDALERFLNLARENDARRAAPQTLSPTRGASPSMKAGSSPRCC